MEGLVRYTSLKQKQQDKAGLFKLIRNGESKMYECFHCGCHAVSWDSDFDFEDMGYEGEGVVHICHCSNCGAEIEYRVANDKEENNG